mgnify:CR=1 FL=1
MASSIKMICIHISHLLIANWCGWVEVQSRWSIKLIVLTFSFVISPTLLTTNSIILPFVGLRHHWFSCVSCRMRWSSISQISIQSHRSEYSRNHHFSFLQNDQDLYLKVTNNIVREKFHSCALLISSFLLLEIMYSSRLDNL